MQLWTWVSAVCSCSYGHGSPLGVHAVMDMGLSHSYGHGSLQCVRTVMNMDLCRVFMQLWTWVSAVCSCSYGRESVLGVHTVMDVGLCSMFMQLRTWVSAVKKPAQASQSPGVSVTLQY